MIRKPLLWLSGRKRRVNNNKKEKKCVIKNVLIFCLPRCLRTKKEAFVEDLKTIANVEEGLAILKKYGISLTEEELKKLNAKRELSDDELDDTSGGGCPNCDNCFGDGVIVN